VSNVFLQTHEDKSFLEPALAVFASLRLPQRCSPTLPINLGVDFFGAGGQLVRGDKQF
jgi:hypothetical protein